MYARLLTWRNAKNIDDGVAYLREKVMPTLGGLSGFRGVTASADRADDSLSILSLWETEADREASVGLLAEARREAADIVGGELTVENYEQLVAAAGATTPTVGSWLRVRSLSMEPANIAENLVDFQANVLPRIKANAGFQDLRMLMDRTTGTGYVGTVWSDEASMMNAAAEAESGRQAALDRGVTLGETDVRRILFGDLH
jgi:heme-degrading monooxygenase HmoA